jgi:threonyl-tRNA synthetase
MSSVRIVLPDNSTREFPSEPTVLEVAKSIGPRLAQDTVAGSVNGQLVDLRTKLSDGTKLRIVTIKDKEANEVIRHSAAHVMAQAVQEIWPDVKVTIGPVIDDGFFYDFDSPRPFSPDDLQKIELRMKEITKRDLEITRTDWPVAEAIQTFEKMGESFKVEIITDLKAKGETAVGVYKQGEWFDLCRGPHVQRTSQIKALKVMSLAGAYWRGDEKNKQLQRVYATAFTKPEDLEEHLKLLEEAKKRDHRRLGKDLGLFHFSNLTPGGPFFTGRGTIVYNELVKYIRELYTKYDYQEVITPQMFDTELFKTSGHMDNYAENMFFSEVENRQFSSKPMNCPSHCVLFGMEKYSYRDLPLRMADFGP